MNKEYSLPLFKTIPHLACLLCLCHAVTAQIHLLPGYTVDIFGATDGLPSSEILCLHQDARDFMWIGTRGGISRYDGKRFENFEYVNNNRIGAVHCIAEDGSKTLWISTETGLYKWNEKSFAHLSFPDEAAHLPFKSIHFSTANEVWLGTARGPVHFESPQKIAEQPLTKNRISNWETVAKDDAAVTAISSSKKGAVFGAFANVYVHQNGLLKRLPNKPVGNEYLQSVFMDDAGFVYWNNVATGFHFWNGAQVVKAAAGDAFYFDIVSEDGNLYVYTNNAIKRIDAKTKHTATVVDLMPLEINTPTRLLLDKEGAWWAGTTEGVYHLQRNPFTTYHDPRSRYTDVYSMLRRRNGNLLMGANRGKIFLVSDSVRPYQKLPQVVPLAEVFDMYEDEDETMWFATGYQGLALFKNGRLKNFTTKNGLPDNSHNAFFKSSRGDLWTCGDMGITRIRQVAPDSFSFQPFFHPPPAGGYHKVYGMAEAPDGSLWAGGQLGLFYLDKGSLKGYTLPEMSNGKLLLTAMKMDRDKNVWLSTRGNGILLCRFDDRNRLRLLRQWKTADGTNADTYLGIAFDAKGTVWAGGYNGLTAIVCSAANKYSVKNFDVRDGFLNKNYQSLSLFADGDTLWACTSSGALSFRPSALLSQPRIARLYITTIDLLNTKKEAEEYLTKDAAAGGRAYRFPYSVNSFSVQFAAPYYANPQAVRYSYRLQGIDSGWTSTGNERTILFRQLPPGEYALLVKAFIGGSDQTNTAVLSFHIGKPWWLQSWVMTLAAVFMAAGAFSFVRSREQKLKREEQRKTELAKLKAAGYQHQLEIEQVVNYFATSLNEYTTVDDVLWDVVRNCIARLGFEDCVIYVKNEAGDRLVQKAAWGPKTTGGNGILNPIEIPVGQGIVGSVAATGKAEKIDDAARASELTVPIFDEGKVIGVIDSEHSEKGFYTDRHLHILTTIASHCGAKISTLRAEAKTASARMDALLSKQKALEASLQSMRLQMNPHFLFNALNSIQQMILSGEETTATRFLSKFSKLLRTVLTNSDKEEISLKEEMDLLQLYVELESLRFKDSFRFFIHCDENIDTEEVFVPALFFQPMVENAIWHGLMHKEKDRKLFIGFEEKKEGCLRCTVEDNGVGRTASKKNGGERLHTGKGLSVAVERLRTLNEKNNTASSLSVIDLKDETGRPAGTRIEVMLHYQ